MRLTIFKKGMLLISLPLLFQFVFVAFLVRARTEAAEAEQAAMHSKEVIARGERAFSMFAQAVAAGRGMAISGEPRFIETSHRSLEAGKKELASLDDLASENATQRERVRKIQAAADDLAQWLSVQRELVAAGRFTDAQARVADLSGQTRLEAFQGLLQEFLDEEARLDADRARRVEETRAMHGWLLGMGTVAAIVVAVIAMHLFVRSVTARVDVLIDNAERLAENAALSARVEGSDEIARLDEVMHETSRRLLALAEREKQYKAEIEQRAAALATTNENLRQQTQENEMFVYSVSHDLRSPLVNLQGFSKELAFAEQDLQRLLSDPRVPADLRESIDVLVKRDVNDSVRFIQSAVTRSGMIIDALLRLSRAGRVEYRWQQVALEPIITRIIDAMRSTIEQKQAQVTVTELKPCWGDPTAVEQVFGNLIGNAINYLKPGEPGRVEVGLSDKVCPGHPNLLVYYVRDNGVGIPAAYQGKIFVAFQRLHGALAVGEGIGLALVRRVVERHGGQTWVESVEGQGSTFYVALPAQPPQAVDENTGVKVTSRQL